MKGEIEVRIKCGVVDNGKGTINHDLSMAASRIQGIFRGKAVRRAARVKIAAATSIQAAFRAIRSRKLTAIRRKEKKMMEKEERAAQKRRRNIREQQRELQLLRNLSPAEVATYLEYRRNRSARMIQRMFKRHRLRTRAKLLAKVRNNVQASRGRKGGEGVYVNVQMDLMPPLALTTNFWCVIYTGFLLPAEAAKYGLSIEGDLEKYRAFMSHEPIEISEAKLSALQQEMTRRALEKQHLEEQVRSYCFHS